MKKIVVIGGGQAGGRLAHALGPDSERFRVTLVCREPHPPYERPPLSKGVLLGTTPFEKCLIWPAGDAAWSGIDLRVGVSAEAIDRRARTVRLSTGKSLAYDILVLATGSDLRRLSVPGSDLEGIHNLRSVDDALGIARRFEKGKRLVVVGGGFIGLEIAASARSRDLATSVIEASDRLLARVVPPTIAGLLAKRHEAEGVTLHMGTMVERFISNGHGAVSAVELSSGQILPCDLAVVGVGVKAEVDLAVRAGLDVDVGIAVDSSLRTSDPAIFACGDVATFWHPLYDQHVRVEAWQNAEDHARVIAAVIRGEEAVSDTVPWFWSDQYDLSLQVAGLPRLGSSVVSRTMDDGAVILFHLGPNGRIVGATGLGPAGSIGRDIRIAQALIARRAHPAPSQLQDPSVRLKTVLKGAEFGGAGTRRRGRGRAGARRQGLAPRFRQRPPPSRSASADILVEHRLEVEDRRPVQRFETAYLNAAAFDGGDLDPVETDGIGAVRRAGAEDALLRPRGVAPRMHAQNVAARAIEPGDQDDLYAGSKAAETLEHFRLEDQPGRRRAFVGLPGSRCEIGQRRLDPADGFHLEAVHIDPPLRFGSPR